MEEISDENDRIDSTVCRRHIRQAPSPVQTGVAPNPNGSEPIFRVDVTSKTVSALNYHNRQGTTHIDFRGTALMPDARGEASVDAKTGATRVSLNFDRLSNPAQFGPEYLTFVLWAITPEGRAERLGEVTLKTPKFEKRQPLRHYRFAVLWNDRHCRALFLGQ